MKIFVAGATGAVGLPLVRAVYPGSRGYGQIPERTRRLGLRLLVNELARRETLELS
jgi:hypothetical protein